MNDTYGTTVYFTSQSDARSAADDLRRQGMDVDVRSSDSHGKNDDNYSGGAVLVIENGDPQSIMTIVTRYNGTVGGSSNAGASGTTTGDIDYGRDVRDDLQRTGARSRSDVGELADADLAGDDRTL